MNDSPNMIERLLGRCLAACVHPWAAWRLGSTPVRVALLAAYFGAGYVVMFSALALLRSS